MFSLPIYELGLSLHFLKYTFAFFVSFIFSYNRLGHFSVCTHCLLFLSIINEISFIVSSRWLLSIDIIGHYSCLLIQQPATLPNYFIACVSFSIDCLGLYQNSIVSSTKIYLFGVSFQILLFPCFVALPNSFNTTLHSTSNHRHLCLGSDFS